MIVNLQRKVQINSADFKAFVESLSHIVEEAKGCEFSVAFVSDRRMKELNGFFRGKTTTTDVLSFPHEPDEFEPAAPEGDTLTFLGDIVISVEQAQKQAGENGLTIDLEIKQLILHGLLHLCGFDHETDDGEMNKREIQLRRKLKI
jgi:probable rRNA maturation factor